MKKAMLGSVAVTLMALGCGGDEPDLSQQEAFAAFGAASMVAGQAGDGARSSCTGCLANADATVDAFRFDCPEGGTIDVSGTWDSTADAFTYDFALTYSACGAQGYVISGNLDFSGSATSQNITFSMNGTLSFSGLAQGSCGFNIEMVSTANQITYSGTVCGHSFSGSASG